MPSGTSNQVTTYVYSASLTDKGCPVNSNSYLRATIYPDSDDVVSSNALSNGTDGVYNRVQMTYNADGTLATRQDNRQITLTFAYDNAARPTSQTVTSGTIGGDQQVQYAYTDLGQPYQLTAYSTAGTTIASQLQYAYNGLGQVTSEYQEHSGAVNTSTTAKVQYAYDTTVTSSVFTSGHRLTNTTYPNGRVIWKVYDGHDGIDALVSRPNKICEDNGSGTPGSVIAQYSFLGQATPVVKDYPTPKVKLDLWGGTSGTYAGLDLLGRTTSQGWVNYNSGSVDLFRLNHGYDRNSNRLYAQNTTQKGASQVYTYDNLNRLTTYKAGSIKSDHSDIAPNWLIDATRWTLDAVGNQTAVDYFSGYGSNAFSWLNWFQNTPNAANEYTSRKSLGGSKGTVRHVYFQYHRQLHFPGRQCHFYHQHQRPDPDRQHDRPGHDRRLPRAPIAGLDPHRGKHRTHPSRRHLRHPHWNHHRPGGLGLRVQERGRLLALRPRPGRQ